MKLLAWSVAVAIILASNAQDEEPFERRVAGGINRRVNEAAESVTHLRHGASEAVHSVGAHVRGAVNGARQSVGEGLENAGRRPVPGSNSSAARNAAPSEVTATMRNMETAVTVYAEAISPTKSLAIQMHGPNGMIPQTNAGRSVPATDRGIIRAGRLL